MRFFSLASPVLGGVLAVIAPAHAELQLCNQTSYVLYAAVGAQQSSKIITHGWTRLIPGDCANALSEPLKAAAYFAYARSAHSQGMEPRIWGGQFQFCVKDEGFSLAMPAAAPACTANGAAQVPFAPIATGGAASWAITFTEAPGFASPDDARAAGLRRLLTELGYTVGASAKELNDALAQFRVRAGLTANPAQDQLFAALEAAASKAPAEQGYSICNVGNGPIWAALGLKSGRDFVSQGWWSVGAGACVSAISTALPRDAVYLFASKEGNSHLVSGPSQFCIANTEFVIRGRDRCGARGLSAAGFVATNVKGQPGFTARIGNNGLTAP